MSNWTQFVFLPGQPSPYPKYVRTAPAAQYWGGHPAGVPESKATLSQVMSAPTSDFDPSIRQAEPQQLYGALVIQPYYGVDNSGLISGVE